MKRQSASLPTNHLPKKSNVTISYHPPNQFPNSSQVSNLKFGSQMSQYNFESSDPPKKIALIANVAKPGKENQISFSQPRLIKYADIGLSLQQKRGSCTQTSLACAQPKVVISQPEFSIQSKIRRFSICNNYQQAQGGHAGQTQNQRASEPVLTLFDPETAPTDTLTDSSVLRIFQEADKKRKPRFSDPSSFKKMEIFPKFVENPEIPLDRKLDLIQVPDDSRLLKFMIREKENQVSFAKERFSLLTEQFAYQMSQNQASDFAKIQKLKANALLDKIAVLKTENEQIRARVKDFNEIIAIQKTEFNNRVYWLKLAFEVENRKNMEKVNWRLFKKHANFDNPEIYELFKKLHKLKNEKLPESMSFGAL